MSDDITVPGSLFPTHVLGMPIAEWLEWSRQRTPEELRHHDLAKLQTRIVGILEDEGWPPPACCIVHPEVGCSPGGSIAWPGIEDGSGLTFDTFFLDRLTDSGKIVRIMQHGVGGVLVVDVGGRKLCATMAATPLGSDDPPLEYLVGMLRKYRSVLE